MRRRSPSPGRTRLPDGRLALLLAAGALITAPAPRPDACGALAGLSIPHVSITAAERVDGGICRVTGTAHPAPGSAIGFELRLPPPARWSGRYYQIGNGGFAGAIHQPTLAEGAARGDAIAGTDTGHRADPFDASWADDRPARVIDYGYRSIKATSDAAAALVRAYYGHPARHRYFMGCSNGGRMALMAAARYPDDWDGVIAGAPANPWTRQFATFDALQHRLRASPGSWLTRDMIVRCHAEPRGCRSTLTPDQRASFDAIARAGYDIRQADPDDWVRWIANPDPAAPSQKIFADQARAHLTGFHDLTATLDVAPAAFARFRARGGVILSYFGEADAVISPRLGRKFYADVARANGGMTPTRAFYRLFMVPGMIHCQGGPGIGAFGQSLDAPAAADDSRHDVRRALEAWVERRRSPAVLIAARYGKDRKVVATHTLRPS